MKRYQIFISSTYADLKEERLVVIESILKLRHFPAAMEHFTATSDAQFNHIKKVMDESDYYILIIGNRYGSVAEDGISYTEKEYDYAVDKEIPILAFVHSNPNKISVEKSDQTKKLHKKLVDFKRKIANKRLVCMSSWETPDALAKEVVLALNNAFNDIPRPGWVRMCIPHQNETINCEKE